jgi:hypothetical protein
MMKGFGSVLVTNGSGCVSGRPKNIPYGFVKVTKLGSRTIISKIAVLRIRIRIRIRIHMFLGLPDPDPLVRGMDPDPDPALDPDPDPSIIMQK